MSRVLLKKSSVAGKVPVTSLLDPANGLEYGELALNYADGKLYFKNSSNVITSFSSGNDLSAILDRRLYTVTTAGSNTLSVNYVVGFVDVFVNGVRLNNTEFTATSGTAVVIPDLLVNDEVQLVGYLKFSLAGLTINGSGLAFDVDTSVLTINSATTATANTLALRDSSGNLTATNLSGTNTGDNAVNSLYSGLVTNAAHTGDATGSTALTLATVNANVGAFGSATNIPVVTVNAKGLVTAVSTVAVSIPSGAITITGDVSGSGTTGSSTALTLATVNSNIGTWNNVTVNAKGLVTGGSNTAYLTAVTPSNFSSQVANTVLAAPNGTAGAPTFRAIVGADIPTLNQNTTGTAATITGVYSGTITSSQVTTGLGFTPYNATNPSGYTTNTGTVTSVAALTIATAGTDVTSTVATGTTTAVITLNIPTASATNRGALSAADWTTFNNKQAAGTYATGTGTASGTNTGDNAVNTQYSGLVTNATHTGDVTGSTLLTLATVNSNIGTWNNVTVNGKGLVTAGSNTAYLTAVTATAPVASSGGTTPVISMAAATASANGYMTSTYATKLDGIAAGATTNTGTVTSVAALTLDTTGTDITSTVATSTTTPVITLNIPTASATNRGALSAADWTTFNNKVGSLTDTLATVTGRGATTTTAITVGNTSGTSISITSASAAGTNAAPKNLSLLFLGYNNKEMAKISSWDESASTSNANLLFWTGGGGAVLATERMRLDSSGNLGIGTTLASSYSMKLAVVSNIGLIPTTQDTVGSIVSFKSQLGSGGGESFLTNQITAYGNAANYDTAIAFSTRLGTTVTERMRLHATGKVLIGTATSVSGALLQVKGTDADNTDIATFYANQGTRGTFSIRSGSGINPTILIGTTGNTQTLALMTVGAERMRVTSTGSVGINTIEPTEKLEVVGNIKHTGLVMTAGTNVDQIYTASDVLTLTTDWQDTSVNGAELTTGSYMVQAYVFDATVGGGQYYTYYTGVMSWYSQDTNETSSDEIVLHRAGHASNNGALFLRILRTTTADANDMKLQIAGTTTNTGTSTYTYKFRRLI